MQKLLFFNMLACEPIHYQQFANFPKPCNILALELVLKNS